MAINFNLEQARAVYAETAADLGQWLRNDPGPGPGPEAPTLVRAPNLATAPAIVPARYEQRIQIEVDTPPEFSTEEIQEATARAVETVQRRVGEMMFDLHPAEAPERLSDGATLQWGIDTATGNDRSYGFRAVYAPPPRQVEIILTLGGSSPAFLPPRGQFEMMEDLVG